MIGISDTLFGESCIRLYYYREDGERITDQNRTQVWVYPMDIYYRAYTGDHEMYKLLRYYIGEDMMILLDGQMRVFSRS